MANCDDARGDADGPRGADFEAHERWEQMRSDGECVLFMDSPLNRRRMEESWTRRVERSAVRRARDGHVAMFRTLGLSDDDASKFDRHLSQVVRATAQAEAAISQLRQSQHELDIRLGSMLSEEQRQEYRRFEDVLKSGRDVEEFSKFLDARRFPGSPEGGGSMPADLAELIADTGAWTFERWGGPFDPIPEPAVGLEQVAGKLSREALRVGIARERVIDAASDRGYPTDVIGYLNEYYRARQEAIEETRSSLMDREASEERMNALLAKLKAEAMARGGEAKRPLR